MRHAARKRPAGTSHAYVNKLRCDSAGLKKRELAAHGPEPGQGRGGSLFGFGKLTMLSISLQSLQTIVLALVYCDSTGLIYASNSTASARAPYIYIYF